MGRLFAALLLAPASALALEDDFLDDGAPCYQVSAPPELHGPLRTLFPGTTNRACLRTEAAVSAGLDQRRAWGTTLYFSWRTRKRAETFVSLELLRGAPGAQSLPGHLRWGIAFQAPLEARRFAASFNAQLLLPTLGAARRTGGSVGAELLMAYERGSFHLRSAVTTGFYEQADGRWLFGASFDATGGITFAPLRPFSVTFELQVTAGHFPAFRGAAGTRFTFGFFYLELAGLTPAVGGPQGFEGVLTFAVQPFESFVRPRFKRRAYYDELG